MIETYNAFPIEEIGQQERMNEIEIQKHLVKEAFNKSKSLPDFGSIGEDNTIKLRNFIWKVCGYLEEGNEKSPNRQKTIDQGEQAVKSKKNALVIIYRLWSAFTKNMRNVLEQKSKSVSLNRFGIFSMSSSNDSKVIFIPSSELINMLNAQSSSS